jgi:hypothetical protein
MTSWSSSRRTTLVLATGLTALGLAGYGLIGPGSSGRLRLSSSSRASDVVNAREVPVPPKPDHPVPPNPNGDSSRTPVIQWKGTDAPGYVAYSIDYVVDQVGAKPTPTWYWATQMGFQNGEAFYMGLQPDFGHQTRALFSVFGAGTTPLADTCNSGADGGSGTSCSISYPWKVGKTYRLTVAHIASGKATTTWRGTIRDLSLKKPATQIGKWSVPASWRLIAPGAMSWSEWFGGNIPCSARTRNSVYFRHPFASAPGGKRYREVLSSTTEGTCAGFTPVEGWVLAQAGA